MTRDAYGPALGADARPGGTRFALWTNCARTTGVRIFENGTAARTLELAAEGDGFFALDVPGVGHGTRYQYVLDGTEVRDAYAKFLPDGVESPAMVWEPQYSFKHPLRPRPLREHVIYELHVGTFTVEGTYASAALRLPELAELGVTAIELMPIG